MRKSTLFIVFSVLLCKTSFAQQNTSSPYSRFAFGDLGSYPLAHYASLGGASIGVADTMLLNLNNPASFANLTPTRPIFDVGLAGQRLNIQSKDAEEINGSFGLRNIVLGIPISHNAGFSFGLIPFSSVGYTMRNTVEEENIGPVKYTYTGSGGINQLYLGAGYKIFNTKMHFLSIGLRSSYLFGNLQRTRKAVYPSFIGVRHTKIRHSTIVSDFLFDGGLLYQISLSEIGKEKKDSTGKIIEKKEPANKNFLSIGLTYTAASEISARQEMFAFTFFDQLSEALVDTVKYQDTIRGYMSFPSSIGLGLAWETRRKTESGQVRRMVFSGQYLQQSWSTYSEVFGSSTVTDQLSDSRTIGLGFQYTPDVSMRSSAKPNPWKTTNYRMGLRYSDTYLQINNTQLKQYGISFGLGIPLFYTSQSLSHINIGCEAGRRGTTENQLLQENYFNFFIGFSMSPSTADRWFLRRKYD